MQPRLNASERSRRKRASLRAGFTLLEMLLVFALVALFATLFVVNASSLVKQSATQMVEARFWEAVRQARSQAIVQRVAHAVSFDRKALAFVAHNTVTGTQESFVIKRDDWPPNTDLEIALKKRVDRSQLRLIEGELVAKSVIGGTSVYATGERVFHQKFGYGRIAAVDGNKLTIDFEKAGQKRVLDSFVERH